jgi:5,10-methylenetetrahydromethanopterin reductase
MAARGPKMLELAGEIADGVITHGLAPSYVDFCLERIRAGAERAGRQPEECELVLMFEVEMRDDVQAAVDHLRPRCTIMAGGEYAESLIPVFGLDPAAVMSLRAAVRARDPDAGRLVTDEMVHAFAVAGSPDHLAARVQEMADAGVGRVILVFRGDNPEETGTKMEQVGKALAGVVE